MSNLSRRTFLATTATAAAAVGMPALGAVGANERIRIGFIGVGSRGGKSLGWFGKEDGVDIAYLCDADQDRLDKAAGKHPGAKTTQDMRRLLDDKDIDAVVISTCNHWHALATVWACQAGKDVYVEKPVSHNVWEGRKMVEAARRYDRIVQGGTQQRSDPFQAEVKAFLDSGTIGNIKYVRLNRYGQRKSIGKRETPLSPPANLDYNLWLGPAQDQPMYRNEFHYDWHWVWNTGNGDLGNWGPHLTDDLRNVVFRDRCTLPKRVVSGGGRLLWNDAGDTPNTHFIYFDTGSIPVIMDVHNLPRQKGTNAGDVYTKRRTGAFIIIECEDGYYAGGRGGGSAYDRNGEVIQKFKGDGGGGHAANFIKALRSRKRADLNAEIEEIHYSSAWSHLGNISWRLGQAYQRAEAENRVPGYEPWNEVIGEFHAHLEANEIDMAKETIKLGPMLEIDQEKERFVGPTATPEAQALLQRDYRKGFEVPDKV